VQTEFTDFFDILSPTWGWFHQHFFVRLFLSKNLTLFGEWQTANRAQVWQILGHKNGKFGCTVLEEIVGEIEWWIFVGVILLGKNVWWNQPQESILPNFFLYEPNIFHVFFKIKLGHFRLKALFSYVTNIQAK
jgi:hypothetical protein